MEENRRLRYRDKILFANSRIVLIETWFDECSKEGITPDIKTTLAIYKAFQEVTEVFMDIIAMYLRDQDIAALDDYSNIGRADLFSSGQKDILRSMNGLRNRIIHRYNGTDERIALTGIFESLDEIKGLVLVINRCIEKT